MDKSTMVATAGIIVAVIASPFIYEFYSEQRLLSHMEASRDRADRQKVRSDLMALENSLDMYRLDNGQYPTEEQGLYALINKPNIAPEPSNYDTDGYLRRLPEDPWGNEYILKIPGTHGKIDLFSVGIDALEGTDDDIGNWSL